MRRITTGPHSGVEMMSGESWRLRRAKARLEEAFEREMEERTRRTLRTAVLYAAIYALAVALIFVLSEVAWSQDHESQVRAWHAHYLALAGLDPEVQVLYVPAGLQEHPNWCGWISWEMSLGARGLTYDYPFVAYSECATQTTVLHEVCHLRMQHQFLMVGENRMPSEDMHIEVERCMAWYRDREARR